ncbi:MAG: hypothetical protein HRT97_03505 [Moritella sp.]|nr:hypothetical protein [Moritella sp.]
MSTAWANFSISPMNQYISPKHKTVSYTLQNLSNKKAAYKITALIRHLLPDGTEQRKMTKELRVFPSKIILEPGQKKRIKVLYLGSRQLRTEKAYRVIFKQTGLDVSEQKDLGPQIKYEFVTALYVTPKKAAAEIKTNVKNQGQYLELVLHNSGNKHHILQDWQLKLFNSAGKSQLYTAELPAINLLANTKITLKLAPQISMPGVSRAELLVK